MIILGIDPGTTSVGYALLEGGRGTCRVLSADLVRIKKTSPHERLAELASGIEKVITKWRPEALGIERLFFAKNQKTALAVAEARGVILLTASRRGLMVYEYTPLEIKKTVTGDGAADKEQLEKMVRLSLPETKELGARDDVFDAIAAALTCYIKDVRRTATAKP